MNTRRREQWGAATGYLCVAIAASGMLFEHGAPALSAGPGKLAEYAARYRSALLAQSLVFVLGSCVSLWFLGCLRSFLRRAEGEPGTLSALAFGAGCVYVSLGLTFQCVQIAGAAVAGTEPAAAGVLGILGYTTSVVMFAPFALMLVAVALLSLVRRVLPVWLGVSSAAAAAAEVLALLGILVDDSIFTPGGPVTYVACALLPVWLIATATTMICAPGRQKKEEQSWQA